MAGPMHHSEHSPSPALPQPARPPRALRARQLLGLLIVAAGLVLGLRQLWLGHQGFAATGLLMMTLETALG
jgi:hypothetical protein